MWGWQLHVHVVECIRDFMIIHFLSKMTKYTGGQLHLKMWVLWMLHGIQVFNATDVSGVPNTAQQIWRYFIIMKADWICYVGLTTSCTCCRMHTWFYDHTFFNQKGQKIWDENSIWKKRVLCALHVIEIFTAI